MYRYGSVPGGPSTMWLGGAPVTWCGWSGANPAAAAGTPPPTATATAAPMPMPVPMYGAPMPMPMPMYGAPMPMPMPMYGAPMPMPMSMPMPMYGAYPGSMVWTPAASTATAAAAPPTSVTTTAPVNIAVIKYWGKKDVDLMVPLNSSLSGTLNQDDLASKTSVLLTADLEEDQLWLNGTQEDIAANGRVQKVLELLRAEATAPNAASHKLLIVSENNFPTAAGLASSASGYACLVYAVAQVLGVKTELSAIARRGSGSASRSIYGGWVKWNVGTAEDGSDSIAEQVADEAHWPSMRVLVLVANDAKKHVSSSKGMQLTAATSPLMPERLAMLPARMAAMEQAILSHDYATFADLTMKDSDNFHATCATTEPPIHYMTAVSHDVVKLVNAFNAAGDAPRAAYTFDAGPNAVIYLEEQNVLPFLAAVLKYFPPADGQSAEDYLDFAEAHAYAAANPPADDLISPDELAPAAGRLKYMLHTSIGDGPRVLPESESLIDVATLGPKA